MKATAVGFLLFLLPLAHDAMAGESGSFHDAGSWKAPINRERLRIAWEAPRRPITVLPSPPLFVFVARDKTPDRERIERDILADVRTILALRGFTAVRLAPNDALDLPWLRSVIVRDPMIVVVGGNSEVVGTLSTSREFKVERCLDLLARAAGGRGHLSRYLRASIDVLRKTERAWKDDENTPTIPEEEHRLIDGWETRLRGADAAVAGPSTEAREAVRFYRRSERGASPRQRAAAVDGLGLVDSGSSAREILAASRDESLWVRLAAGRALARMKSDAARDMTLAALDDETEPPLVAALLAFERIEAPALAPRFAALLESDSEEVRYAALRALVPQQSAAAFPALVRVLRSDIPALRVVAARALARIGDPRAIPALVAQLGADDWSVRKAAIEALGSMRHKACIPPLIERMDREDGHVRGVARTALIGLTAIDWGVNPGKWKAWWRDAEASFTIPTANDAADALSFSHEFERAPSERECAAVRTHSRRLVFVIDLTAGMNERVRLPVGGARARATRFEAVRAELISCLKSLDRADRFNIITFAEQARSWKSTLVQAGPKAKRAAVRYLMDLTPNTWTPGLRSKNALRHDPSGKAVASSAPQESPADTYAALRLALGLAATDDADWKRRCAADTVFLFTAQFPCAGEIHDAGELVRAVSELNVTRGVVFHLVSCNEWLHTRMAPLAGDNGGRYVLLSR